MGEKVVVFGSYVTDLTCRGHQLPASGETVMATYFKTGPGGKGSNQAVAAHRAGADVMMITKLGDDLFGQQARDFYQKEGMRTQGLMIDGEQTTGSAVIMVSEATGQNQIMVYFGACDHISDQDILRHERDIAEADILLVQFEINLDALEKIIRLANRYGTRVILNPAPARTLSDELMAMVDTVTPNETEACTLTGVKVEGLEDAHKAAEVFFAKGVKNVVITMGCMGVYATDGHREELLPRIPVQAVDTTGAGDAFNGGFVMALAEGHDLFTAARYGNCTGALSVTRMGTAPANPYRDEIVELYHKTYEA